MEIEEGPRQTLAAAEITKVAGQTRSVDAASSLAARWSHRDKRCYHSPCSPGETPRTATAACRHAYRGRGKSRILIGRYRSSLRTVSRRVRPGDRGIYLRGSRGVVG